MVILIVKYYINQSWIIYYTLLVLSTVQINDESLTNW